MSQKGPHKQLLLTSLSKYYAQNQASRTMLKNILTGNSISLRVIDWFVTHYAPSQNIVYWIDDKNNFIEKHPTDGGDKLKKFHLYLEYRSQLKSYTKLHFDPFRRHERITFILDTQPELVTIETTVGQLNFFRWCFQNHVITYILKHILEIEKAMTASITDNKIINIDNDVRKTPSIHHVQCHLKFD